MPEALVTSRSLEDLKRAGLSLLSIAWTLGQGFARCMRHAHSNEVLDQLSSKYSQRLSCHGNELSGDTGIASQPPSPCCDALQGVSCSLPESMSMAQLGSSATDNGSSWSQEVDLELALTTDNTSCESSLLSPNSDVSLGTLQNMVAGMPNGSCNTTNLGNTMAADRAPATAQTLDSQTHGQQPPSDLQPEKRPKRKRVVKAFPVVGTAGNPGMSRSLRTRKT